MFRHILIPTDGSEPSMRAATTAIELARRLGARVTVLHAMMPQVIVVPDMTGGYAYLMPEDEYERIVKAEAVRLLEHVATLAREANVPCETVSPISGSPWQCIVDTATARGCDAIVMASHGRKPIAALLLGSETTKVLTHCTIPVLVTR
jgi:nucleotide-binding universal stress UspA family protein